jgi:hypothetical protein
MKNKAEVFSIVLFLLVLTIFVSCQKKKIGWEGKIDIENGVKVIKIPMRLFMVRLSLNREVNNDKNH